MVSLEKFILTEFKGSKKIAAKYFGVWPSQISKWLKSGDIVIDNRIYKQRLNMDKGE